MQYSITFRPAKWHFSILLSLLACLSAKAQTVENVRDSFIQAEQLMYIYYDLKGLNYKKEVKITPYIQLADGTIDTIQSLSGDFGWIRQGGKNKLVTWDPFKDGVDSLGGFEVKIIASEMRDAAIPTYHGILYQGSNSAPFGLKYMRLSEIGFFAGARMGNLPPSYPYTVSDAGDIDYSESGVYEIGDEKLLAGYAITAGPVFQIARSAYVYAGAGYGLEQLFWEYQAYNRDKVPIGTEWALNESINYKGIAVDAGIVMRFGHLLLEFGGSTIQFKSFQITGGIGWAFFNN